MLQRDVSFTATERKFTQNLPPKRISEKSNFFPYHIALQLRCFNVQVNIGQTRNEVILLRFLLTCYYKTLFFVTGGPCNQEKSLKFFTVCKLYVNFYSVAV